MFLKVAKYKNGKTFLSCVHGYRDKDGKSKQKTITKFGYLSDLEKEFNDPISHFKQVVKTMDNQDKNELTIKNIKTAKIEPNSTRFNLGYFVLKNIYNELGIPSFLNNKQKSINAEYSLNDILQLLVFSRIINPSSKRETFNNKESFFEKFDFSLKDIYRSLDHLNSYSEDIQATMFKNTSDSYKRDTSVVYYDCTNYYFEISYNDEDLLDEDGNVLEKGFRKKGPSKEHRKSPIVSMGLLMDSAGIPLSFNLFPGNESEKTTLRPELKKIKNKYALEKIITVADRGLNTSDNTIFVAGLDSDHQNRNGYIYGQSILSSSAEFKKWVLEDNYVTDIITDKNGNTISFKHKSRNTKKTVQIMRDGKRKNKVSIDQKQMVYYSEKYAKKQKREREIVIEKAKDLIANPGKYNKATSYGATAYVNKITFDDETGVITEDKLSLNMDKIKELEQFDGYYSIVTSELDMDDITLRNKYKGLWEIEETFKITKSNLKSRPVYVWTKEHIQAHFLTCFISLVILRLLEKKLDEEFSINQIINSVRNYNCSKIEHDIYMFDYTDKVIEKLESIYNIDLTRKYQELKKIKEILKIR